MITVDSRGTVHTGDLAGLRDTFSRTHMVRLPGFLSPDFVTLLQDAVAHAEFAQRVHEGIGRDQHMMPNPALSLVFFALNAPELLHAVEAVSGVSPLDWFFGHVFRLTPGTTDSDSWHSDADGERQVCLTVNLGATPYEGGLFQLKEVAGDVLCGEVANVVAGDAVLFRIHPDLKHRASPVTGTVPRVTLAGWFQTGPDFRTVLKEAP